MISFIRIILSDNLQGNYIGNLYFKRCVITLKTPCTKYEKAQIGNNTQDKLRAFFISEENPF